MKKNRPVYLDLSTIKLPITAYVSITHRISGVILLGGILLLFWMFDASLRSESSFDELQQQLATPLVSVVIWLVLVALAWHFWMGIRHLVMDLGYGESLRGGRISSFLGIAAFVVSALALAGWILW